MREKIAKDTTSTTPSIRTLAHGSISSKSTDMKSGEAKMAHMAI